MVSEPGWTLEKPQWYSHYSLFGFPVPRLLNHLQQPKPILKIMFVDQFRYELADHWFLYYPQIPEHFFLYGLAVYHHFRDDWLQWAHWEIHQPAGQYKTNFTGILPQFYSLHQWIVVADILPDRGHLFYLAYGAQYRGGGYIECRYELQAVSAPLSDHGICIGHFVFIGQSYFFPERK